MKRQILKLIIKNTKPIKIKTSATKEAAVASYANGGIITKKGIRHGN